MAINVMQQKDATNVAAGTEAAPLRPLPVMTDQLQARDGMRVAGAYARDGVIVVSVEVDRDNLSKLHGPGAKKLAYDYRILLGMANAGIEEYGGTEAILDPKDPSKATGYRKHYRLNPGI